MPNSSAAAKGQLTRLQSALTFWTEQGLITYHHGAALRNNIISWPNYSGTAQFKNTTYRKEFIALKSARQFTAELNDGGMIQIYYSFGGVPSLSQAKFAYFPKPTKKNNCQIRFDFDFKPATPLVHETCHLQLSSLEEFRFPAEKIPTIECFFEFIARSFYLGAWGNAFPKAFSIMNKQELSYDEKLMQLCRSDLSKYYEPIRLTEGITTSQSPFWPLSAIRIKEW